MIRATCLVRVSTKEQHLVEQFRGLRAEAERRGWKIVSVFRERVSTRRDRPQLTRLLADAMMRRFDAVLVWRLDRLGRSLLETFGNVERLHERGVQVVSVKDGALDTSTPSGRLQIGMLCACAEYERGLVRERTIEGLNRVRRMGSASGKPIGRPRAVLDLDAIELRIANGTTFVTLAKELGVSERTLRRRFHGRTKAGVELGLRNGADSRSAAPARFSRSIPVGIAGAEPASLSGGEP